MSGWRDLAARLLRRVGASASPGLGDWLAAALAELPAIPRTGAAIGWMLGLGAMLAIDLLGQALFPWRRGPDQRPPARFVAWLGLALLIGPAWRAAAGGAFGLLAGAALALSLWINLGALLRAQPLGGMHYAVAIRHLPLNLGVAALAVALGAVLL